MYKVVINKKQSGFTLTLSEMYSIIREKMGADLGYSVFVSRFFDGRSILPGIVI